MPRLRTEIPRFSLPETVLVILVGAALIAGIYAMIHMLARNDRADAALTTLAYIRQHTDNVLAASPVDPWGNDIRVVTTDNNFSVTYPAVPKAACKHIAKHFDRSDAAFISLSINSTVFRESAEEINARTIADACEESENALMIWTFSRTVAEE